MVSVLQYGAIGIGLAVLAYTAAALKLELGRPEPRPEGRNLILIFMVFSLAAFGIATFIELKKQDAEISEIVSALDANLGDKYHSTVLSAPEPIKAQLLFFEKKLCDNILRLKKLLSAAGQAQCVAGQ